VTFFRDGLEKDQVANFHWFPSVNKW
jgi:hypothetical protein